jgi:hypothetical protein
VAYSNAPGGTTAEADAALAIIKPALGLVFGSLFAATVYGLRRDHGGQAREELRRECTLLLLLLLLTSYV